MSTSNNRALRTSVWHDMDNLINMEVVYEDTVAKSKWSVRVMLTPDQAESLAQRLLVNMPTKPALSPSADTR